MDHFLIKTYTRAEIDNFIASKAEESIYLEFKRGDALKNEDKAKIEISKDVSSFANADGGIIIYGIEEDEHVAKATSFINGNIFTKEWLEQIINSKIKRKIDGLTIDCIRYDDDIKKTVYVVKIPRSFQTPHIASDYRFYKRTNFSKLLLEEYEIRDLYHRHEKTQLSIVEPKFKVFKEKLNIESYFFNINIEFNIKNIGRTIEKLYKVEIYIPRNISLYSNTNANGDFLKHKSRMGDDKFMLFSFPNGSPLFQEQTETIASVDLNLKEFCFNEIKEQPIKLKLYYTNGTEEKSYMLLEMCQYNGRMIELEDFKIKLY